MVRSLWLYQCRDDHVWPKTDETYKDGCPKCGGKPKRLFKHTLETNSGRLGKCHFNVGIFNPYEEWFDERGPTVVTSARQRDQLCDQHYVTYDSHKTVQLPKPGSAVENLDYGEVLQETIDAPEPERPTERADDPRRDPGSLEIDTEIAIVGPVEARPGIS